MLFWSRKAMGALKDAASVGFAMMSYVGHTTSTNTRLADIDVAIVKATRHNDIPPKEKRLLILLAATGEHRLRRYIKYTVEQRLKRTKNWMVAVKTLSLIHGLMMAVLPCIFAEEKQELQHSSDTTLLGRVSKSFEDCSSSVALEFSLWARKYSSYLVQRLHCCSNYEILDENQNFEIAQLLEDLRSLHLLLGCLLNCTPPQEGPVAMNSLIHYALDLLVKECPKICAAMNECIRKLLDYSFVDFTSDKALFFVYICEQILQQYDKLSDFYDACTRVGVTEGHGDYPSHKRFLSEMEDRIQKYRHHHIIHLEEEHIAKKETALKKETPQDAVEEERLLITWCDSHDDEINFGSKSTEQEANYESNHAVKEWERAWDMSIKDPSSPSIINLGMEWTGPSL